MKVTRIRPSVNITNLCERLHRIMADYLTKPKDKLNRKATRLLEMGAFKRMTPTCGKEIELAAKFSW